MSRRNFRIALLAFVATSLVLIVLALEHQISHWRWQVKTLSDADRSRVVPVRGRTPQKKEGSNEPSGDID